MRESAQRECEDVLERAASEAIPERNVFQKIRDFFADFPFVKILLGILIAVVAVFFPVAGALLGGALFALDQFTAIATGNFGLGDFRVGLISLVPGGILLKAGGAAFKGGLGAVGGLTAKGAKAVGGAIGGVKTSLDKSKTVGALLNGPGGLVVKAGGEFAEGVAEEAATQALNGDGLDAGAILGAGALGLVGGGPAAGGKGKLPFPQKGSAPGGGKGSATSAGPTGPTGSTGSRAVPGPQAGGSRPKTGDEILDTIIGKGGGQGGRDPRRNLGGFEFGGGTRNNGGKNLISRPVEVVVGKDAQGKDITVAVHLNVMLNPGNEVVRDGVTVVNIKGSLFHLTARSAEDQKLIDKHGPSALTADTSVHVGPGNAAKGWSNDYENFTTPRPEARRPGGRARQGPERPLPAGGPDGPRPPAPAGREPCRHQRLPGGQGAGGIHG
jgi:hypothetical protein